MTPRFLYANPIEPVICPILALGTKSVCATSCGTSTSLQNVENYSGDSDDDFDSHMMEE